MLAMLRTMPASRIVMKVAYWLRLASTSITRSLPACPRSSLVIRARRLMRASRNNAVAWMNPRAGIDPIRSSQPRSSMKYARVGFARMRFIAKSSRKMTQTALS